MRSRKLLLPLMALLALVVVGCTVRVDPPPPGNVVVVREPWGAVRTVRASVNLRTCPSTGCPVIMTLREGDNVRILRYQSGWANVITYGSDIEGWMSANYFYN